MSDQRNLLFPIGGGDEIGASSYLLQINGRRVLIDAGLRLNSERTLPKRTLPNYTSLSNLGLMGLYECECACITHAHLDHVGSLPAVFEKTRSKSHNTPFYSTQPTIDIASVLLNDTVKIRKARDEYKGDIDIQEFEKNLVQETIESIKGVKFGYHFNVGNDIKITFFPAGHILGAAMILLEIDGFRTLFTGDFCGDGQLTVPGYRLPDKLPEIDLMVCESTYAYKISNFSFRIEHERFIEEVKSAVLQGGKVLIPAFAVGRAQEVIMLLRKAKEEGEIPIDIPIYSDGMVNQVCEIYNEHKNLLSDRIASSQGNLFFSKELNIEKSPFNFRLSHTADKVKKSPPCCIVASSGMLVDGSCSSYYAHALIGDARNRILFTGYLDEESPGHKLLKTDARLRNWKGEDVAAQITPYHLSAHASLEQITELIERINPRQVIFVHGKANRDDQNNLFAKFFEWGRRGIIPYISANQGPIYLG